jgi:dihydroflavonol-4-reductase
MTKISNPTVLVTGASGFIAMHCVVQLLEQGYHVRGTLRSMERETHLRQVFAQHTERGEHLEFVSADLLQDAGWEAATEGCEYVLHLASPFPLELPENEDNVIIPARDGTLRVLRAAAASGVKRVVLTSSIVAITEGHGKTDKVFDESDWSILENITPYPKSKTIAEKAAWDFINRQDAMNPMELAVINPTFVMGPLLDGQHFGTSAETIRKVMAGEYPGTARITFNIVDVRDVAAAHVAAMTAPQAAGKRYLCASDTLWFRELCQILNQHFGSKGYKISTLQLPDIFVRVYAIFDKSARGILDNLGRKDKVSTQRIIQELNWEPKSAEEAIIAMAESLIQHGIV